MNHPQSDLVKRAETVAESTEMRSPRNSLLPYLRDDSPASSPKNPSIRPAISCGGEAGVQYP